MGIARHSEQMTGRAKHTADRTRRAWPTGRAKHTADRPHRPDRRAFLRCASGAALSILAVGARAALHPRPASAGPAASCCSLARDANAWCPYFCGEIGGGFSCWACNNGACLCCECIPGGLASCFYFFASCSYSTGCCERAAD